MLTIKHVETGGSESIVEADSISFEGEGRELIAFGVKNPISGDCNRYADGKVFVMNENGKTVGVYNLDAAA